MQYQASTHQHHINEQDVESLIGEGAESTKMKDALKEMKEFQYYYSATASLLQVGAWDLVCSVWRLISFNRSSGSSDMHSYLPCMASVLICYQCCETISSSTWVPKISFRFLTCKLIYVDHQGITDSSDRRKILTAVQKIKENLPSGSTYLLCPPTPCP